MVRLPNGTYIQRVKTSGSTVYKNEAGVVLEVGDNREIIIEPIIITDINASGNGWHKTVAAPYTYTITGSSKIGVSRSGNTLTITGKALGEASITITSGAARTVVPVVVADRVLDVPHIRQAKSQRYWAACAQMLVQYYDPDSTVTQAQMVWFAHGNDENFTGNTNEIKSIIEEYTDAAITIDVRTAFGGEGALRQKLDNGEPVIYLTNRINTQNKVFGHCRVIYGYYLLPGTNKYVYLVHDPWDPSRKYDSYDYEIGGNVHYDIWRRSWINITDEEEIDGDIPGVDRLPRSGYSNYTADWFIS